jgi:hypothetical protein
MHVCNFGINYFIVFAVSFRAFECFISETTHIISMEFGFGLIQDRDWWRARENTVMNLLVMAPWN